MDIKRITLEQVLYAFVLLIALTLRLLNLGAAPLTEGEASLALQAHQIAQGEPVAFGPQPAYTALTSLTFALIGSSDFTAHLWPALAGGILVLLPYFFRRLLGRDAALILSFGLALDAGLVAVSRQADGPIMALSFSLLAIGLVYAGQVWLAGVSAGLAFLSGPALWSGLVGFLLAWGIHWLLIGRQTEADDEAERGLSFPRDWDLQDTRNLLIGALATMLVAGTLFFRSPQGLSAWLGSLPIYLSGWSAPSNVPALRLLAALPVYQPLAFVFALVGAVRAWLQGREPSRFLSLWAIIALTLAVIFPARQVIDLVWVLVPLWALAALELGHLLSEPLSQAVVSLGQAALLFVLSALIWLNLAALGQWGPSAPEYLTRVGVIVGVLALGVVSCILAGLGWSWQAARQGLVLGLCSALGIYSFAGMWWSAQVRSPDQVELWQPVPSSADADLLMQTVDELSEWRSGEANSVDVTLAVDSPALRWALRQTPRVTVSPESDQLLATGSPSIVITRQGVEETGLAAAYRGQDFVLRTYPGWEGALPPNLINWLTFRQAPRLEVQVILWARTDLFPGGSVVSEESLPELDIP